MPKDTFSDVAAHRNMMSEMFIWIKYGITCSICSHCVNRMSKP